MLLTFLLITSIVAFFSSEFLEDYGFDETIASEKGIKVGFDRLVNFSDAVIAIIITVMVIELKIPPEGTNLVEYFKHHINHFLAFFLSFVIVGAIWLEHHKVFRYIKTYNNKIMAFNIFLLLFLSLMPFATGLFASFNSEKLPFIFYITIIGLTTLMRYFIIKQAETDNLFCGVTKNHIIKMKMVALTIPCAVLLSAILTVLIDAVWGAFVFIFLPVVTKRLVK